MKLKIYRVPASHPCQAVIRAAELKGIDHKVVDLAPMTQPIVAKLIFGSRTVPAMKVSTRGQKAEKVQTTASCLRTIESLVPEPRLYPAGGEERERVLAAEEFGLGEFQQIARRVVWVALAGKRSALFSFESNLPFPDALSKPFVGLAIWGERKLNNATDAAVRADLEGFPAQLDEIDRMIEAGVIGGPQANAGDLTIFSSLWLLRSLADLLPLIDSRPCGRKTRELFGEAPGDVPAGALPAAWLTSVNAAAAA